MKQYVDLIKMCIVSILCSFLIICNGCLSSSFAQIEIPSSPNPVGSGARAIGMGGAFIGVADDATAASWNPGGLIQLDFPEISFVGDAFHRIEDNSFGSSPGSSGDQTVSDIGMNYLSVAYPFKFRGYPMIISVNYQYLFDFTRKWNFPLVYESEGVYMREKVDYQQEGKLSSLGIAGSIQINPRFSFGFTLNIWDDGLGKNEWETKVFEWGCSEKYDDNKTVIRKSYLFDRYTFSGFNANLGFLWNVNGLSKGLTVGAVFKTPFEADLKHEYTSFTFIGSSNPESPKETNETMDMPMSYGIGFAYRFSDKCTASLDIYRTEWDDFVLTDSEGKEISPVTWVSPDESDIEPTHQLRIGAEYLFIKPKYVIPVRCGIFYDPAPARGSPDDFFGFSIGTGIGLKQFRCFFDIAYQYRFGNDVRSYIMENLQFSQDVEEHYVYSSVIIQF